MIIKKILSGYNQPNKIKCLDIITKICINFITTHAKEKVDHFKNCLNQSKNESFLIEAERKFEFTLDYISISKENNRTDTLLNESIQVFKNNQLKILIDLFKYEINCLEEDLKWTTTILNINK
mgnify:CR=1 FL=1